MNTGFYEVGLLVLIAAVFVDEGSTCSIMSPECYKETTKHDEDFLCEWTDEAYSPDTIYTIFLQTSSVNESSYFKEFNAGKHLSKILPVEDLITAQRLDIWVQGRIFNMTCSSPAISVILKDLVKYSSPIIQKKIRSSEKLTLSWPRLNDNKGAVHEIRWKRINDSWQNTSFITEDRPMNGQSDSYALQLPKHEVYQVQIRRKAKQSLLWSDWSLTADIPTEIQQPVVRWREETHAGKREITLKWENPPPEASFGGVSYNLTVTIPCYKTKSSIISKNTFKIAATYSQSIVAIVAINSVGSSPPREILIPPVEHLEYCLHDSYRDSVRKGKRYCLEWYKLKDGETRRAKANTSWTDTLDDIKRGMEKFERYYYYIHAGRNQQRHTRIRCPVYSAEAVPSSPPNNVTVLNITHDSALLWWQSISIQDQRGFLTHYVIRNSKEGRADTDYYEVTAANETSFVLRNLEPGSAYTVSIAGKTKIGEGPNSTRTFFTSSSLSTDNGLKMVEVILTVCGVVFLISVALTVAVRKLKSKLLPVIPSPVISPAAMPHMDNQNVKPLSEEVDEVILLRCNDQDKHNRFPKEKLALLHDCEVSVEEDEEDNKEDEAESHFAELISSDIPSSFPNPNYKGQLLRLAESLEITDKGQMESCEVNTPLYKNGLYFENRPLDNEGMSVQL